MHLDMLQRRPVISQPMPLRGAAPLPVGIVPFCAPEKHLALVVKVTCELRQNHDGSWVFVRSAKQDPLSLPKVSTLPGAVPDELVYPGDFVPRKTMADVLVTGCAHAQSPTRQIQAEFHIGTVSRVFVASTDEPVSRIPLTSGFVREMNGAALPIPRKTPPLLDVHPYDFDYAEYNAAPTSQRTTESLLHRSMRLHHLVAGKEDVEVRFPDIIPNAVLVSHDDRRIDVPLRCDTFVFDSIRNVAVVVFRGDIRLPSIEYFDLQHISVWTHESGKPRSFDEVLDELPRGVFGFATTADDLASDAPSGNPAEVDMVRYSLLGMEVKPMSTLERYATISAELAEGKPKREEVLQRHGFDEERWLLEERAIWESIAEQAKNRDTTMVVRYGELFVMAQDALAEPWEKNQSVDDYVDVKAAMNIKGDPSPVLQERNMRLAPWMRLERSMLRQSQLDPQFATRLEQKLAAAMRRFGAAAPTSTSEREPSNEQ